MSTEVKAVIIPFTKREIAYIISWKEEIFWPDEMRLVNKLRRALDGDQSLELSRVQLNILWGWAEDQMAGSLGKEVRNTEERAIMDKLQRALQ